jgi:hypothetical protein
MINETEHWQVHINGKNTGIREVDKPFAEIYWATQARYRRFKVELIHVSGPRP